MLHWSLLVIPFIFALLHRMNGEDAITKLMYFIIAGLIALIALRDLTAAGAFMLVFAAQVVPPTHSLFSAAHGRPPGRKDAWKWRWMQDFAFRIVADEKVNHWQIATPRQWRAFGVAYGALRASLTLVGIAFACGYLNSWIPLAGVFLALTGAVYYFAGDMYRRYQIAENYLTLFAEPIVGWMIGTYMLIVAAAL